MKYESMKDIKTEEIKDFSTRFKDFTMDDKIFFEEAFDFVKNKVNENLDEFTYKFPSARSENLVYESVKNADMKFYSDWTSSFWTGMLWLVYEMTNDENIKKVAEIHINSFKERFDNKDLIDHHDLGFLYSLSCVAGYKLTGNELARETALAVADHLANRYVEKSKIIQNQGDVSDLSSPRSGSFIIDCCMNLPLLYWASNETGNKTYYNKAYNHMMQAINCLVREDASTFQAFKVDSITGEPVKGWTNQGYKDDSCWARGQAWGIYGSVLSYKYTGDRRLLEVGKKLTNYYLNRLPEDEVCNWDLFFTQNDVQRDSSASSIAVCGILEIAKNLPLLDKDRKIYENAAITILKSMAENYTTANCPKSNGILLHAVYSMNKPGVDECCIWGDYFYTEALVRVLRDWDMYW